LALAYQKHPVEFSKNNHTPTPTHNREPTPGQPHKLTRSASRPSNSLFTIDNRTARIAKPEFEVAQRPNFNIGRLGLISVRRRHHQRSPWPPRRIRCETALSCLVRTLPGRRCVSKSASRPILSYDAARLSPEDPGLKAARRAFRTYARPAGLERNYRSAGAPSNPLGMAIITPPASPPPHDVPANACDTTDAQVSARVRRRRSFSCRDG